MAKGIQDSILTGGDNGSITFDRCQKWINQKPSFILHDFVSNDPTTGKLAKGDTEIW